VAARIPTHVFRTPPIKWLPVLIFALVSCAAAGLAWYFDANTWGWACAGTVGLACVAGVGYRIVDALDRAPKLVVDADGFRDLREASPLELAWDDVVWLSARAERGRGTSEVILEVRDRSGEESQLIVEVALLDAPVDEIVRAVEEVWELVREARGADADEELTAEEWKARKLAPELAARAGAEVPEVEVRNKVLSPLDGIGCGAVGAIVLFAALYALGANSVKWVCSGFVLFAGVLFAGTALRQNRDRGVKVALGPDGLELCEAERSYPLDAVAELKAGYYKARVGVMVIVKLQYDDGTTDTVQFGAGDLDRPPEELCELIREVWLTIRARKLHPHAKPPKKPKKKPRPDDD